ncbi:hypothetical protein [Nocardia brevicatena]|uniref:hypothetical protein n=1 Tax=Nocardia brevicatena TaxID=37327 RepID=UPI00059318B3|nr:hypothetical protein [Nocardia brevicatena]
MVDCIGYRSVVGSGQDSAAQTVTDLTSHLPYPTPLLIERHIPLLRDGDQTRQVVGKQQQRMRVVTQVHIERFNTEPYVTRLARAGESPGLSGQHPCPVDDVALGGAPDQEIEKLDSVVAGRPRVVDIAQDGVRDIGYHGVVWLCVAHRMCGRRPAISHFSVQAHDFRHDPKARRTQLNSNSQHVEPCRSSLLWSYRCDVDQDQIQQFRHPHGSGLPEARSQRSARPRRISARHLHNARSMQRNQPGRIPHRTEKQS